MTQSAINPTPEGKRHWEIRLLSALSDHTKLSQIIKELAQPFTNSQVQQVVCFEALGFPLGAGVAQALSAGLVLVRKKGREVVSSEFETETFCDHDGNQKTFKVLKRVVQPKMKILIVDDLLEKGHQLRAATAILKRLNATVIGAAFISCRGSLDVKLDSCYGFRVHHLNDREELVPWIART